MGVCVLDVFGVFFWVDDFVDVNVELFVNNDDFVFGNWGIVD